MTRQTDGGGSSFLTLALLTWSSFAPLVAFFVKALTQDPHLQALDLESYQTTQDGLRSYSDLSTWVVGFNPQFKKVFEFMTWTPNWTSLLFPHPRPGTLYTWRCSGPIHWNCQQWQCLSRSLRWVQSMVHGASTYLKSRRYWWWTGGISAFWNGQGHRRLRRIRTRRYTFL